jgi:hypothetical protein
LASRALKLRKRTCPDRRHPRKNKDGKVIGYRGSYFTPDGTRLYVSGKTKSLRQ